MDKSLNEIAQIVGGTVDGEGTIRITGLNGLKEAQAGDISFFSDPRYEPLLENTPAAAILAPEGYGRNGLPVIHVADPYLAFAQLLKSYESEVLIHPREVHPTAVIAESAQIGAGVALDAHVRVEENCEIGENVILYAGVYVGRGSRIGRDTVIYPNTTVRERTTIGARCIIHSNVAIGSDGFGFAAMNGTRAKIPQVGTVTIGDDVEIGSNSAIDRSTTGTTSIGNGTKIDNLVQIGHNCKIGEHCAISGGSAIAGSTIIGSNVMIGGHSSTAGHLTIGDNVMAAGRSGITKSVPANSIISGLPHTDHSTTRRIWASLPYLPKALRRIRGLEDRMAQLEGEADG